MTRARTGWLAGTTALVSGASGRLGRAFANADAREGDLLLDGRRPEPLERVREEVEALGAGGGRGRPRRRRRGRHVAARHRRG